MTQYYFLFTLLFINEEIYSKWRFCRGFNNLLGQS